MAEQRPATDELSQRMDQLQAVLIAELSQRVNQLQVALFAELSQRMDQLHAALIAAIRPPSQATQKNEPNDDGPINRAAEDYGRPQTPERNNPVLPPTPEDTPYVNRIRPMMPRPAEVENPPVSNREVNDQSVQDPELPEDYRRLPNLRAGKFICYYDKKQEEVPKGYPYSSWKNDDIYRLLRPAICFDISGRYVNPSRVDPRKLSAQLTPTSSGGYNKLQVDVGRGNFKDAVCISPIYTFLSSVVSASPGTLNSKEYKYISGLLHTQEWERMMATMCMAFDKTILQADLRSENIISFSTPVVDRGTTEGVPPNIVTYDKFIMNCGDEIPVYDATGLASLPLNEEYLDRLRFSTLPRWRTEIPTGSCAIVAYSASCSYVAKISGLNKWRLYTNIKWVIILGRSSN
ncbi:hypothetical protein BDQ17DRAFT_1105540 [Cyathus striatus]|nr:hypothetical protein BDQ17DRAFT_1105540 [Cyathus striatus]